MNRLIHEEVYRGEALLKKMAAQPFVICGAGAIGSNLVNNMVRQGFEKITVIDFDRIEDHNLHTQVWGRRHCGQLKAGMLKNIMHETVGARIEAVTKKLEKGNCKKLLPKGSVVIDGFDNAESRNLVADYCRDNGIECLHSGLYQDCAEVTWNERYILPGDPKGGDVCEYPLARNVIMLAVAVTTDVIIRYLDEGVKENYTITLKDFRISLRD